MKKQFFRKRRFSIFFTVIAASFLLGLSGCAIDITNYTKNRPQFDLFEYFTGTTRGWGIVQDRSGELLRQFVVDITGTINSQKQLVLVEKFYWNDGGSSDRTWVISKDSGNRLSGTAGDVIGRATGRTAGNALNWSYQVEIPVSGKTWAINFDDWMFLQPDGILLNRAEMSKFGFRVGEVTIAFTKTVNQGD